MLVGYARVSTAEQSPALQQDALTLAHARAQPEAIDTTTSGGKLIFHLFGAVAEFERDIIRERTKAGWPATAGAVLIRRVPMPTELPRRSRITRLGPEPTGAIETRHRPS